jgi:nicotinamidase-related amidase
MPSFKAALVIVDVQEDFCPPVSRTHATADRR